MSTTPEPPEGISLEHCLDIIRIVSQDIECYCCTDGVPTHAPCAGCLARAALKITRISATDSDGWRPKLLDVPNCNGPWVRIEQLKIATFNGHKVTYGDGIYYHADSMPNVKWWRLPIEELATSFLPPPPQPEKQQ